MSSDDSNELQEKFGLGKFYSDSPNGSLPVLTFRGVNLNKKWGLLFSLSFPFLLPHIRQPTHGVDCGTRYEKLGGRKISGVSPKFLFA